MLPVWYTRNTLILSVFSAHPMPSYPHNDKRDFLAPKCQENKIFTCLWYFWLHLPTSPLHHCHNFCVTMFFIYLWGTSTGSTSFQISKSQFYCKWVEFSTFQQKYTSFFFLKKIVLQLKSWSNLGLLEILGVRTRTTGSNGTSGYQHHLLKPLDFARCWNIAACRMSDCSEPNIF